MLLFVFLCWLAPIILLDWACTVPYGSLRNTRAWGMAGLLYVDALGVNYDRVARCYDVANDMLPPRVLMLMALTCDRCSELEVYLPLRPVEPSRSVFEWVKEFEKMEASKITGEDTERR